MKDYGANDRFPWASIIPLEGKSPQIHETAYVAPGAQLIGDVTIGAGASIWFNCVLRGDRNRIVIGERSNVQDGTVMHADPPRGDDPVGAPLIVGNDVAIGHMALIHGCTIEDRGFVGMNAIMMNKAVVSSGSMLAAGAMLTENKVIPPGQIWTGRPAKFFREQSPEEAGKIRFQTERYCRLAERYLAQMNGASQA